VLIKTYLSTSARTQTSPLDCVSDDNDYESETISTTTEYQSLHMSDMHRKSPYLSSSAIILATDN